MRSTPRLTGLLAVATLLAPVPLVLSTTAPAQAAASDVQITEWAYNGSEFVEITNTGSDAVDLTGWSFDDSSRTAGAFPIGSLGTLRAGESAIVSEATAAVFRAEWDLPVGVKVAGGNDQNLGRSDEMNIYDAGGVLVDRLTYDDQTGLGPRTDLSSAWVPNAAALAHPDATGWTLSAAGDAEGSWTSAGSHAGSPGTSTLGGAGTVRITEWAYSGSEFFEITNLGAGPADLTGWSSSDSARTPNAVDLSPLGVLARGESAVVSEATADAFRTEWDLPATVKVLGANPVNLGRSDEINVYDAADVLVDRLTYDDQGTGDVAGPRTDTASAWVPEAALGANTASAWTKSTAADAEGSWTSAGTWIGSPGTSTLGNNPPGKPGGGGTGPDPSTIKLNEVESNGDAVGDWVEITNTGTASIDVSGWKVRDADASHPFAVVPTGTTLAPGAFFALYTEFPPPGFGLGVDDAVTLYEADGTSVVDTYAWSGGHAATTYGRCPDGTGTWEVTTVATRGAANACSPIRINEIESSDAAAGPDWVELVNLSDAPVDLAGWVLKDGGDADPTTLPTPSVVPAHGHLVVNPLAGLGGADSVRLFDPSAKLIDSHTWTAHATQTYGRCKDGVGAFVDNVAPTPGAVNSCPGLDTQAWPGSQTIRTVDQAGTFNQDASGLVFDPEDPTTLWVAQNKAGTLTKLVKDGAGYVQAAGWAPGRNPRYADGTGAPDTEGITIGPDHAIYLAAERNNDVSGVSKNVVLRYEPGTSMNATDEWAIPTSVVPAVGANLGLEGITWVPDSALTAGGLVDQSTGLPYAPGSYPAHGTGLYVVAVEGTGKLYVLALDQTAAVQESVHLVATIDPQLTTNAGPPGVMDVVWDPEGERLWAICDDSCDGTSVTLELQQDGAFGITAAYQRPVGMPNLNNEGFALAPQSTCVAGQKAVLWSDDGDTDGFSLREGTFPCTEVTEPTAVVNTAPPLVKGTARVGATLTGTAGTWTPAPGATAYQWLANGSPVAGATGPRLVLTPALAGRRISLRVTASADGFLDAPATSAPTAPVAAGTLALAGKPRITGKARVGTKVAVRLGRVSPAAKVGYAWYVDGRRIAGAKGAQLRLVRKWAGHRITVKVTYTSAGYAPATVTSPAVKVRRR